MGKYFSNVIPEIKDYFKILSEEFPEFLEDYISTPEMQRIGKTSMFMGKEHTKYFPVKYPVTNLDHSVEVALILWHFTHDKAQTLAGLFHDIAVPVFKHCIDYMNGDYETQESTEERTESIIRGSKQIMELLNRDGIKPEEVIDYKIYPLADSPTPRLSADRFGYTFSCGLSLLVGGKYAFDLDFVKKVYEDVVVGTNEYGLPEFSFKHKSICEEYIHKIRGLWVEWNNEQNKVYMNFLGDICKAESIIGELSVNDLYTLSEIDVINKIKNSANKYIAESFEKFLTCDKIDVLDEKVEGRYCFKTKGKKRFLVPLVQTDEGYKRITEISEQAKIDIESFLSENHERYGCLEFDFDPEKV